jgi:hypothetical protein
MKNTMSMSMIPSGPELKDAFRVETALLTSLRFLVVDDNALNKRLFARTVDNMFTKLKRTRTPIYTFASNGRQSFPSSLAPLLLPFFLIF